MSFNLKLREREIGRSAPRKTPARGAWPVLALLGAGLGMLVLCDVLLSSGRFSSLLIDDAGAAIAQSRAALQLLRP